MPYRGYRGSTGACSGMRGGGIEGLMRSLGGRVRRCSGGGCMAGRVDAGLDDKDDDVSDLSLRRVVEPLQTVAQPVTQSVLFCPPAPPTGPLANRVICWAVGQRQYGQRAGERLDERDGAAGAAGCLLDGVGWMAGMGWQQCQQCRPMVFCVRTPAGRGPA